MPISLNDITLANRSTIVPYKIGTVLFLSYVNSHSKKNSLSGICYCSKLDTKLVSLDMLDKKELVYSSQQEIFRIYNSFSIITIGYLTSQNLYKINLFEVINNISA